MEPAGGVSPPLPTRWACPLQVPLCDHLMAGKPQRQPFICHFFFLLLAIHGLMLTLKHGDIYIWDSGKFG